MKNKLIEPDSIDKMYWYRIQTWGKWYAVQACCRRCATNRLHGWTGQNPIYTENLGEVKTLECPDWLVAL